MRAEHNFYRHELSDDVARKAREEIIEHEAAVFGLQTQIEGLLREIRQVEEEKRKHLKAITQCRAILTLATRIPNEILSRIFEIAVLDGWTRAPVVVSQVCSSWRDAARAPVVWSHIYVDCDKGDPVARCQLWLRMSLESPLNITFRTSERTHVMEETLSALLVHNFRWRSFTLEAPNAQYADFVFGRFQEPSSRLEEVSIKLGESPEMLPLLGVGQEQGRLQSVKETFKHARNLRSLVFITDTPQAWVALPQITYLTLQLNDCQSRNLGPILASEILDVLAQMLELQEISLTMSRMDARELDLDNFGRVVTLPKLRSATMNMPISFMAMIQHLRTPVLTSLYLRCPDDWHGFAGESTRSSLRDFMEFSHPPLRIWQLYDVDISQEDFLFCFHLLPTLEELFLHGSEVLDETIAALGSNPPLLPKLRLLDLRWCGHITGRALEEFISSRASMSKISQDVELIQELAIINCSFVNEKHIIGIAEHCKCRLKVRDNLDFCTHRGCCANARYRARFSARAKMTEEQSKRIIM